MCKNGDVFIKNSARIDSVIGDNTVRKLAQIVVDKGDDWADACSKAVKVLGESSDDVLVSLKKGGQVSDEAMQGLVKVIKRGIDPELVKRILANTHLYSDGYKQADLLADLEKVADVPGLEHLVKMFKMNHPNVHGFRFELEAAVMAGDNLTFLSVPVKSALGKTDIDFVAGGIYHQCKTTHGSFGTLEETQLWVAKTLNGMGCRPDDYSKIKYVVPDLDKIPAKIKAWFDDPDVMIGCIVVEHPM